MMDRSTAPATTPESAVALAAAIADARRGALAADLTPWIEEARALVALAPGVRALARRALTVASPPPPVDTPTAGASLDALVQNPAGALALSHETRTALLVRAAGALAALAATPNGHRDDRPSALDLADRLLTPAEAATALGVTVTWLYRHSRRLPFTRRLSRKALRFSEAGLRRWQAARRP